MRALLSLLLTAATLHAQTPAPPAPPSLERDAAGIVTLKAPDADATILYTLDGAAPGAKSNPTVAAGYWPTRVTC